MGFENLKLHWDKFHDGYSSFRSFPNKQNTETLIVEHKLIDFWLPIAKELKIFDNTSKTVLCNFKQFTIRKNILLEIMKLIYKFVSIQNASFNRQYTVVNSLVSLGVKDSKGKNTNQYM